MRFDPFHRLRDFENNTSSLFGALAHLKETWDADENEQHYLQHIFKLSEALEDTFLGKDECVFLKKDVRITKLYETNYKPIMPDLSKLSKLPRGTLGNVYSTNLLNEGFTPDAIFNIDPYPINSFKEFCLHRFWQTHDIVHAITGFDVNAEGEQGVMAYQYANCRSPVSLALIIGGIFKFIQRGKAETALGAIARGLDLGLKANPVIGIKLEEYWERSIDDIREELNIPTAYPGSLSYIRSDDFSGQGIF